MPITLAFDVYGTLIDPHNIKEQLIPLAGKKNEAFAELWRNKQLEYSFRHGLMRYYQPFSVCTEEAFDFVCATLEIYPSEADRRELMEAYRRLPAYPDATTALEELSELSLTAYAFSNGEASIVEALLTRAGLRRHLAGIVSVEAERTFKPNPDVYTHFLRTVNSDSAWLISGNPFDIIGAAYNEWQTVWVRRRPDAVFDSWGISPTLVVDSLAGIGEQIMDALKSDE